MENLTYFYHSFCVLFQNNETLPETISYNVILTRQALVQVNMRGKLIEVRD